MAVKIIVDSTSYIPEKWIDELDIEVVSLSVVFGDESFKETEIGNEAFYSKLKKADAIPTSSQPSVDELYKMFENIVSHGDSIVAAFISSDMSGTYSSAHMVKNMILEKYPQAQIGLIDSRSNCMQLGFVACVAARAAKEMKSFEEVLRIAENVVPKGRFIFLPDTLEYLKKGGRIGSAKALLGSILQIKPILTVNDGKTDLIDSVRTKKKAVNRIIDMFLKDVESKGLGEVAVHHIHCEEEAKKVALVLQEKLQIDEITICPIGPVIGTHVGPGAMGIAYYTKEKRS